MWFRSKRKSASFSSDKESIDLLRRVSGHRITSVTEFSADGTPCVLGKDGAINVSYDDVVVVCNGTEVFRCLLETVTASELLSGNGVRIAGIDHDGNCRSMIAQYSHW